MELVNNNSGQEVFLSLLIFVVLVLVVMGVVSKKIFPANVVVTEEGSEEHDSQSPSMSTDPQQIKSSLNAKPERPRLSVRMTPSTEINAEKKEKVSPLGALVCHTIQREGSKFFGPRESRFLRN